MYQEYIAPIINYIHAHPYMGEFIAFIFAFTESLPLLGTIIPGSITMTAIGALIGAGILPTYTTLIIASLGAFAGDCIGFFIGYHYTEGVRKIWPFSKYPHWLQRGEDFVTRHGGKGILIGRFVGPVRSTVPLIAGLLNLSWSRFLLAAIPSAFLWAIAYIVPGILLGALALEMPAAQTTQFILIGLAIIIFLWLIFWVVEHFFRKLVRFINQQIDRLWKWLYLHHSSKWFICLIRNQQNPDDHRQLMLAILTILGLILYLIVFINVVFHTALLDANKPILNLLQSMRTHTFDTFMILITLFGQPGVALIGGGLICASLVWKKEWRTLCHFAFLLFMSAFLVWGAKELYFSARPSGFQIISKSSSFPSGHVILAITVYGFLAYLTTLRIFNKNNHWIVYTFSTIFILLIAFSRLYLGAHWLTDIIGSFFIGTATLFIFILSYRRMPIAKSSLQIPLKKWLIIILAGILIPWSVYALLKFPHVRYRYTPYQPVLSTTIEKWWKDPFLYLPLYRNNRFGHAVQPFNIQWAASLTAIEKLLAENNWQIKKNQPHIKSALIRLAKTEPEYHQPILPWLYLNKRPAITLIKHLPHEQAIIEIRLWKSNLHFQDSALPLWIGIINLRSSSHKPSTSIRKRYHISFRDLPKTVLSIPELKAGEYKILTIDKANQPKAIQKLNWNGRIIIINNHE